MSGFFLAQDNSSHWYVVPAELRATWSEWVNADPDDPRGWEEPRWALRIDGPSDIEFPSFKRR